MSDSDTEKWTRLQCVDAACLNWCRKWCQQININHSNADIRDATALCSDSIETSGWFNATHRQRLAIGFSASHFPCRRTFDRKRIYYMCERSKAGLWVGSTCFRSEANILRWCDPDSTNCEYGTYRTYSPLRFAAVRAKYWINVIALWQRMRARLIQTRMCAMEPDVESVVCAVSVDAVHGMMVLWCAAIVRYPDGFGE